MSKEMTFRPMRRLKQELPEKECSAASSADDARNA